MTFVHSALIYKGLPSQKTSMSVNFGIEVYPENLEATCLELRSAAESPAQSWTNSNRESH